MDWSWSTIPFNRWYFLVFVALERDLHSPEVETVSCAEVIVDTLALIVCVAKVEGWFGRPKSSSSPGNLDGGADA